jgi:hypothetical protein
MQQRREFARGGHARLIDAADPLGEQAGLEARVQKGDRGCSCCRSGHAAVHWKTTVLDPSTLVVMFETTCRDPLLAQYASAVRDACSSS